MAVIASASGASATKKTMPEQGPAGEPAHAARQRRNQHRKCKRQRAPVQAEAAEPLADGQPSETLEMLDEVA